MSSRPSPRCVLFGPLAKPARCRAGEPEIAARAQRYAVPVLADLISDFLRNGRFRFAFTDREGEIEEEGML